LKQMMKLQQLSFDNYFSMVVKLEDQAYNFLTNLGEEVSCLNEENKKALEQWRAAYKKQRDEFKKTVDDSYSKIESFFDYNGMTLFQEQAGKMFIDFLQQSSWMPKDYKKSVDDLILMYKKGCEEFRKYFDDRIESMKDYYCKATGSSKEQQKTKPKKS